MCVLWQSASRMVGKKTEGAEFAQRLRTHACKADISQCLSS